MPPPQSAGPSRRSSCSRTGWPGGRPAPTRPAAPSCWPRWPPPRASPRAPSTPSPPPRRGSGCSTAPTSTTRRPGPRLLAAKVQALADRGRDGEALAGVEESVAAAQSAGLHDVADEVRVVEARILERAGDPETSRRTLERIIAESRAPGDPAEVRAYHHLGWLHHRAGPARRGRRRLPPRGRAGQGSGPSVGALRVRRPTAGRDRRLRARSLARGARHPRRVPRGAARAGALAPARRADVRRGGQGRLLRRLRLRGLATVVGQRGTGAPARRQRGDRPARPRRRPRCRRSRSTTRSSRC